MSPKRLTLGSEIRRLRTEAGVSLREFAKRIEVSPPHLSDIEHDRRRPSEEVLRRIVRQLRSVGATYEALDRLDARLDPETQAWAAENPGAKAMLRMARESGRPVDEILQELRRALEGEKKEGEQK